ncbi:hypothetical protein BST28_18880 [Mycolicibacter kumamotonensis]|uniref:DUF3168 domain-containing protein n=1 Tax=Mycolicibacter kumamotonensis TaxID=354243 RepID=A0A1X0DXK4_9MYCO|nr:hypothetical protein [Mycolicibacter kumamotonensis]ORA77184.1 hypothetical protein BST28_18880 [Mycolicibacter kumamotonensis]
MSVIGSAVDPLLATKVYLDAQLAERDKGIHIGVSAPEGKPDRYILLTYGGNIFDKSHPNRFTTEHLVDVIVYDKDAVQVGLTTHLILALMLSVANTPVDTIQGRTHLLAGRPDFGPVDYPDPDVPLFGRRMGVRLLMSNSIL